MRTANLFLNFFSSVYNTFQNSRAPEHDNTVIIDENEVDIVNISIRMNTKSIKNIKDKNCLGVDEIPAIFYKKTLNQIVFPLSTF